MANNRFINLLIAIAVVVLVGLTVREASATSEVIAHDSSASRSLSVLEKSEECASLPARSSIHTLYVQEIGTWMPYTEDGPTGVDGGLIYLLSNYQTCSQ